MFITGVVDTGDKMFSGVVDTGDKFIADDNNAGDLGCVVCLWTSVVDKIVPRCR
jgi:hypothetical protein